MPQTKILLLAALLASGVLSAQTPAPSQAPDSDQAPTPLPVPGGGAGLGPGGLARPAERPAPTKEEALKKAKADAEQIADLQARRISQQLSLTPEQFTRVRALLLEREDELSKAFSPDAPESKDHPLTPQDRRLKFEQVQQDTMKRIAALLTPTQKQQFDSMVARSQAERSRRSAIAAARHHVEPTTPAAPGSSTTPAAPTTPATPANPTTPAANPAPPAPQSN
jgi:hypothetical protein